MEAVIELTLAGELWQVTYNGDLLACAATRQAAVNAAAALLRRKLKDPAAVADLRFVGVEVPEFLAAPAMGPNWKRKGPPIEIELFEQAEAYLQTELVPADQARLVSELRTAMQDEDFAQALECLVQLGEQQNCTNPFWRVLARLANGVWPTQWMVDRRARGQREAKIAAISKRAGGQVEPGTPSERWSTRRRAR